MTGAILMVIGAAVAITVPTVAAYYRGIARGRELERAEHGEMAGVPW